MLFLSFFLYNISVFVRYMFHSLDQWIADVVAMTGGHPDCLRL